MSAANPLTGSRRTSTEAISAAAAYKNPAAAQLRRSGAIATTATKPAASTISAASSQLIAKQSPATASATTPGTITRVAPARPTIASHSTNKPMAASATNSVQSQPPA